ncbi:MAG: nucleotidyltransferase domain-containing protein [Clostridiales bacterium]
MERVYTTDEIKAKLLPIFKAAPIEKAILFGSYAKGTPTQFSDIDIVIDSKGKIRGIDFFGILEDITEAFDIPIDLIEASQIVDGGRAQQEIAETGIVIYERTK